MNTAIVTDSTCDLPHDLVKANMIHVVPNILILNDQVVEDNENFSRQDFYRLLPGMSSFPTTSTASIGTYQELYKRLFSEGCDQILSIHCSQALSGIFNAATTAAASVSDQVLVIDSKQISLGLGFQVLEAVEALNEGLSMPAIVERLKSINSRLKLVAMLDTLEYVKRSGRVSWARASIGTLLNLKPFLEVVEGQVISLGEVRTRKRGITQLLEMMRNPHPLKRFAILHTDAEEDAQRLLTLFSPDLPTTPLIVNVTTIIGAHVGPNGLGFVALYQNESQQR